MSYNNVPSGMGMDAVKMECPRPKRSKNAGSPAYGDRNLTPPREEEKPMAEPIEETLAAELSGKRKVQSIQGWSTHDFDPMLDPGLELRNWRFCDERRRAQCATLKTCLEREFGAPYIKASSQDEALTPAQFFLKCRKVTIRNVRTVKEEWDG